MRKILLTLTFLTFIFQGCISDVKRTEIIQPSEGIYPVASTNVELDRTKLKDNYDMFNYIDGSKDNLYITDILLNKEDVFTFSVTFPDNDKLYENKAGITTEFAGYILFPSSDKIKNDDYKFPVEKLSLPNMLKAGEKPSFYDENAKYPLIIYAHSYELNPIFDAPFIKEIASHGYIVLNIFFGEKRFNSTFEENGCSQLPIRCYTVSKAIDALSSDSRFKDNIDFDNIGIAGVSFGGAAAASVHGAGIAVKEGIEQVYSDKRFKAASGLIPGFGNANSKMIWSNGYEGLKNISIPYLAVSGEKDDVAPYSYAENALKAMNGENYLVVMDNIRHETSRAVGRIYVTMSVLFFNYHLKNDEVSYKQFKRVVGIEKAPSFKVIEF